NGWSSSRHDYKNYNHAVRAFARFAPDTTFRISLDIRANFVTGDNEGKNETSRNRGSGLRVQEGYSTNNSISSAPQYHHTLILEKKLHPKLIVHMNHTLRTSTSDRDEWSD